MWYLNSSPPKVDEVSHMGTTFLRDAVGAATCNYFSLPYQFAQAISSQESKVTSYKIASHSFYFLKIKKKKLIFPNMERLQAAFQIHLIDCFYFCCCCSSKRIDVWRPYKAEEF